MPLQRKYAQVVEPGAFASFVGRLDLDVKGGKIVGQRYELIDVDPAWFPADPTVQQVVEEVFGRLSQDNEQEEKRLKGQLTELKKKQETLERRYAYELIDREIFTNFSAELKAQVREVEASLEKVAMPLSNQKAMVGKGLNMMLNLSSSWEKADAGKRRRLQALVFPEGVQYDREKGAYRTTRANSFFGLAAGISQKMEEKEKGKSGGETDFSPLVARRGHKLSFVDFRKVSLNCLLKPFFSLLRLDVKKGNVREYKGKKILVSEMCPRIWTLRIFA